MPLNCGFSCDVCHRAGSIAGLWQYGVIMGKPKIRVVNAIVPGRWNSTIPGSGPDCWLRGIRRWGAVPKLQLMAHVSRWLEQEGPTAVGLAFPCHQRMEAAPDKRRAITPRCRRSDY